MEAARTRSPRRDERSDRRPMVRVVQFGCGLRPGGAESTIRTEGREEPCDPQAVDLRRERMAPSADRPSTEWPGTKERQPASPPRPGTEGPTPRGVGSPWTLRMSRRRMRHAPRNTREGARRALPPAARRTWLRRAPSVSERRSARTTRRDRTGSDSNSSTSTARPRHIRTRSPRTETARRRRPGVRMRPSARTRAAHAGRRQGMRAPRSTPSLWTRGHGTGDEP